MPRHRPLQNGSTCVQNESVAAGCFGAPTALREALPVLSVRLAFRSPKAVSGKVVTSQRVIVLAGRKPTVLLQYEGGCGPTR